NNECKPKHSYNPLSLFSYVLCSLVLWQAQVTGQTSANPQPQMAEQALIVQGRKLFKDETFGGNGRTCATCHSATSGTLSPEEVQTRFAEAALSKDGIESDSLFRSIDHDDGSGAQYNRLQSHATIRAKIQLLPNV